MKNRLLFLSVCAIFSTMLLFTACSKQTPGPSASSFTNRPLPEVALEDQHGASHTLPDSHRVLLVSYSMDISKAFHAWLLEQEPDYLRQRDAVYIADISGMPALISSLFAKPKMRKYPFSILLAEDSAFSKSFPSEKDSLIILRLDKDNKVERIEQFTSFEDFKTEYLKKNY